MLGTGPGALVPAVLLLLACAGIAVRFPCRGCRSRIAAKASRMGEPLRVVVLVPLVPLGVGAKPSVESLIP
eukprot:4093513-Heterocapsa_arctica.AAC.1